MAIFGSFQRCPGFGRGNSELAAGRECLFLNRWL
jgi:hypothetical protein